MRSYNQTTVKEVFPSQHFYFSLDTTHNDSINTMSISVSKEISTNRWCRRKAPLCRYGVVTW